MTDKLDIIIDEIRSAEPLSEATQTPIAASNLAVPVRTSKEEIAKIASLAAGPSQRDKKLKELEARKQAMAKRKREYESRSRFKTFAAKHPPSPQGVLLGAEIVSRNPAMKRTLERAGVPFTPAAIAKAQAAIASKERERLRTQKLRKVWGLK